MADLIEQVQIGENKYNIASTAYGVCTETAGVSAKTVAIPGFQLINGVTIHVRFANSNSTSTPTLNVNGTGAKEMRLYDNTPMGSDPETTGWQAGAVISFTYVEVDNSHAYWYRNSGYNTNSTYTVKDTYSGTDGNPISGKGVKAALETLDVSNISGFGADKTLSALSETDGKISASFQNIQIAESQVTSLTTHLDAKAPSANPTFTGTVTLPAITSSSADTAAATKKYVDDKTAGLSGAMHFIGITSTVLTDGATTSTLVAKTTNSLTKTTNFVAGDVVLSGDYEYVWSGSAWELLGGDSSYALDDSVVHKSDYAAGGQMLYGTGSGTYSALSGNNTNTVKALTMTSNTPAWKELGIDETHEKAITGVSLVTTSAAWPTLATGTAFSVPNVTSAGTATSAVVESAILKITNGSAPTLGTAFSIPNATGLNAGTWPTLNHTKTVDFIKTATIKYT